MADPGLIVLDCDATLRNGRWIDPAFAADSLHLSDAGYAALRPVLERVIKNHKKL